MKYKIIRFKFNGKNKVIKENLTLNEAKKHCSKVTTKSKNNLWFDGFTKQI